MEFTAKELTALIKMGFVMATADEKIVDEEKAIITLGMLEFGLGPDAITMCIKAAENMDSFEALSVLTDMNNEQKKYATGFLAAIMVADNEKADSEIKMWRLISTIAHFPTMTLGEALSFWRNN